MERVRVRIYDNRLDKLINDPDGAVGRYLSNKGDQIKSIARSRVGVRTGRLKATIHKRHLRDPRGQAVKLFGLYLVVELFLFMRYCIRVQSLINTY